MNLALLQSIVIIIGLSILVTFICHRLRIPTIVGFFLTGILAGPHGLGLVRAGAEVETLADIGVVLLLFSIGIEFPFKSLVKIGATSVVGGALQMLLSFGVTLLILRLAGGRLDESVFLGFLIAGSSTAITLKTFQEKRELDTPHCRIALAILIFQDIMIVPIMLLTPLMAGAESQTSGVLPLLLVKALGIVGVVVVCTKWVVPFIMFQVARTRDRELFLLSTVALCFAVAWLTSSLGLSLSLGAFLAGLIIADSPYSHQALSGIQPLLALFLSFFFVSLGMLLDLRVILSHPWLILLAALAVLVAKGLLATFAVLVLRYPLRTALLTGCALASVGEFSFVLARTGLDYRLLSSATYQIFLAISVFSMAMTPFLIKSGPRLTDAVLRLPWPAWLVGGLRQQPGGERAALHDHLVLVGFGLSGRTLAQAARQGGIDYVIVEMNPETVRREREKGEPILYGDASQETVLRQADIEAARIVVVAVPDAAAARSIVETTRRLNPEVLIIARTRFLQEMDHLYSLGADEVIPEEFEASMEIFTRVLKQYLLPAQEIERFAAEMQPGGYAKARRINAGLTTEELRNQLPDHEIWTLRVEAESWLAGKTLETAGLRRDFALTVLAIQRGGKTLANPAGKIRLNPGDLLVVFGAKAELAKMAAIFASPHEDVG